MDFTDDRYTDDCHYRGGLLRKYYDVGLVRQLHGRLERAATVSGAGRGDWAEVWEEHLEGNEPYLLEWLRHQIDGPLLAPTAPCGTSPTEIRCPAFLIGGWRDGYPNPPLRLYSRAARVPKKVLVGPWDHAAARRRRAPGRASTTCTRWCAGSTTGASGDGHGVHGRAAGRRVHAGALEMPVVDRLEAAGEWRAESAGRPPGCRRARAAP